MVLVCSPAARWARVRGLHVPGSISLPAAHRRALCPCDGARPVAPGLCRVQCDVRCSGAMPVGRARASGQAALSPPAGRGARCSCPFSLGTPAETSMHVLPSARVPPPLQGTRVVLPESLLLVLGSGESPSIWPSTVIHRHCSCTGGRGEWVKDSEMPQGSLSGSAARSLGRRLQSKGAWFSPGCCSRTSPCEAGFFVPVNCQPSRSWMLSDKNDDTFWRNVERKE